MNKLEKTIGKQNRLLEEHTNFMLRVRETLEDMKIETKYIIANKDKESEAYQKEISRMQVLDRVREQVVTTTLQASVSQ